MSGSAATIRAIVGIIVAIVLVRGAFADLSAQQKRAVFEEAQQAYDRGIATLATDPLQARQDFSAAASRFQLIADDGHPAGPLLYNLGNAYLQSGDLGRAILNYRRAEYLMPGDAQVQNNLQYARSLCRSQIESTARQDLQRALLAWHFRFPLSWRMTAFAIANACFWLVLLACLTQSTAFWRWSVAGFAVVWLATGLSVSADLIGWGDSAEIVLLSDDVVVRKGNGSGFHPKFEQPLHAGVECRVLEARGNWLHVRLANGEEGWIDGQAASEIRSFGGVKSML